LLAKRLLRARREARGDQAKASAVVCSCNTEVVTASLPSGVQDVFARFYAAELTTIDQNGQPITWPVTPYYTHGDQSIDVTTGLGYPKKADDARRNPKVGLLFSDPTGSGLTDAPMVFVQATAEVDDRDLEANRHRYERESVQKLPGAKEVAPPEWLKPLLSWYYTRIYMHLRPERVYVWHNASPDAEPELFDSHMEEVRSGHDVEPDVYHHPPAGGSGRWSGRLQELGSRYPTAVLSLVAPDGFPFSLRVPVQADADSYAVRIDSRATGAPLQAGLCCLTAHDHDERFTWQRNFQARGDLVYDQEQWAVVCQKVISGFEMPPGSRIEQYRLNAEKALRFWRRARSEYKRRSARQ
jgi:hypothetical protein